MDFNVALWSRLPCEIMDHMLSFLPVPDVCRYRSVCKRWNQLICTPEFGALCAQNTKQDASFVVMHYWRSSFRNSVTVFHTQGWCFLDVKARRWYTIKDVDLEKYNFYAGVTGMDGGLFCHLLDTEAILDGRYGEHIWRQIIVYNPIAKTVKKLPIVPDHWTATAYPKLNMVVDSISQGFKIFLINYDFGAEILNDPATSLEDRSFNLKDSVMRVYDSATNEWKSSANPSCIKNGVGHLSSVVFEGLLYVYLDSCRRDGGELPLWRYDLLEDAWENVAVDIPTKLIYYPELIVSANRLHLVTWSAKRFPLYPDGCVNLSKANAWCPKSKSLI